MAELQGQDELDASGEPPDDLYLGSDDADLDMAADDGFDEEEFDEIDPTGRYGRYPEVLGVGSVKTVYRAYDMVDCKEVAWNQAKLIDAGEQAFAVQREVQLLRSLKNKGIIRLYSDWVDMENTNFITELCSASLRGYRKKHKHVSRKAVKSWGRQILRGLAHLHAQNPPIIHRDLKCDNIFVKCSSNSTLKIGDFGSAAILDDTKHLHTIVGTPEFMAPEMFQEDYNELVDVYSFGMCMLELLTRECPYSECKNVAQIYKKVTSGIKPTSLRKVKDVQALRLINRCLLPASQRPSASELLSDPFFRCTERADSSLSTRVVKKSSSLPNLADLASKVDKSDVLGSSLASDSIGSETNMASKYATSDGTTPSVATHGNALVCSKRLDPVSKKGVETAKGSDLAVGKIDERAAADGGVCNSFFNSHCSPAQYRLQSCFQLTGKVEDENTIRLKLRIEQCSRVRDIIFPFDLRNDSPKSVAEEMVRTLEYPDSDLVAIADLINAEVTALANQAEDTPIFSLITVCDLMNSGIADLESHQDENDSHSQTLESPEIDQLDAGTAGSLSLRNCGCTSGDSSNAFDKSCLFDQHVYTYPFSTGCFDVGQLLAGTVDEHNATKPLSAARSNVTQGPTGIQD